MKAKKCLCFEMLVDLSGITAVGCTAPTIGFTTRKRSREISDFRIFSTARISS